MIHGLLFWLDELGKSEIWSGPIFDFVRTKFEYGPLISRVWSGPPVYVVRTSGVCGPDLGEYGPDYWGVGLGLRKSRVQPNAGLVY
jgi:hypothetical protein